MPVWLIIIFVIMAILSIIASILTIYVLVITNKLGAKNGED